MPSDGRRPGPVPIRVAILASVGIGLLISSVGLAIDSKYAAAYLAAAGFIPLAVACWLVRARAAAIIAGLFSIYGGLSAAFAVSDAERGLTYFPPEVQSIRQLGVFSSLSHPPGPGDASYRYALLVTCLGGLVAIAAAWFGRRRAVTWAEGPGAAKPAPRGDSALVERAGRALVAVGVFGIFLAAARYASQSHAGQTPWEGLKSLWTGGSYTLLVALFAIPGFGLWLQGLALRRARKRELATFAAVVLAFALISLTTGQRAFLIEITLVVALVLGWNYSVRAGPVVALAVAAVAVLGVTQAVRNAVRETGSVTPGNIVDRLEPRNWNVLFGSQLASFTYTWDVAYHRDDLDVRNSFLTVLEKPIPRQLDPGKSQGFADDFTRRLYPDAHAQQITVATPLVAESDYDFGTVGVLVILAAVGLTAGYLEGRVVGRAPPGLGPALAAGLIWVTFSLIRGDLANALFAAAGWLLPLAAVCIAVGFVPDPEARWATRLARPLRRAIEVGDPASHLPNRISRAPTGS